ncbi:MAG: 6-phosphofructokinase [Bacillota bacterium]
MMRIAILTSGGDAPGMNACIRAVVRTALHRGCEVYGVHKGYQGLINGDIEELTSKSVGDIMQRGGTILHSARCENFKTEEGRQLAYANIKKFKIEGLIAIGGDGTFRGAKHIAKYGLKTVGIPATIDNDIACTDYAIGFDTAVNTVLDAVNKIRDTASSHERTYIVEVMGRNAGYIALTAGLAGGAEAILIPELEYDLDQVCDTVRDAHEKGKSHCIILVAEGLLGDPIVGAAGSDGSAFRVGRHILENTGFETRITILGHIQRGGNPSAQDRILATLFGAKAVEVLLSGESSKVIGIKDNRIKVFDIGEGLAMKKTIDMTQYELAKILSST